METISLNRLCWFGHVQRMEEGRIPKRISYMNLETTRQRGGPRNRWQDEVREDGRIVGEEGWQEKLHNRGEWKKLLRMARNRRILHMQMEWMNEGTLMIMCGGLTYIQLYVLDTISLMCETRIAKHLTRRPVGNRKMHTQFQVSLDTLLKFLWKVWTQALYHQSVEEVVLYWES